MKRETPSGPTRTRCCCDRTMFFDDRLAGLGFRCFKCGCRVRVPGQMRPPERAVVGGATDIVLIGVGTAEETNDLGVLMTETSARTAPSGWSKSPSRKTAKQKSRSHQIRGKRYTRRESEKDYWR